jgi:hypothetical protein
LVKYFNGALHDNSPKIAKFNIYQVKGNNSTNTSKPFLNGLVKLTLFLTVHHQFLGYQHERFKFISQYLGCKGKDVKAILAIFWWQIKTYHFHYIAQIY